MNDYVEALVPGLLLDVDVNYLKKKYSAAICWCLLNSIHFYLRIVKSSVTCPFCRLNSDYLCNI